MFCDGASPYICEVAKECGVLNVVIVKKTFAFEGRRRMKQATDAIDPLSYAMDAVILVSNNILLEIITENTHLVRSFSR